MCVSYDEKVVIKSDLRKFGGNKPKNNEEIIIWGIFEMQC